MSRPSPEFTVWAAALSARLQPVAVDEQPALAEAALRTFAARPLTADTALGVADPAEIKGYGNHLIYEDPAGTFHIRAMVFAPGQVTPIHDHRVWCCLICHRGVVTERAFAPGADGYARATGRRDLAVGATSVAIPGGTDVHCLQNQADAVGVTVHVYGGPVGPSALNFYEEAA